MSVAGRTVWNWREQTAAAVARARSDPARLRRRGLLTGLALAIAGTVLNKGLGHELAGRLVAIMGAAHALLALGRPHWLGWLQTRLLRFGELVGRALAWLLLGGLWLAVFVPGGLVLRLQGRDPLHRAPLAAGRTAWIPRRLVPGAASCERQFLSEDRAARHSQRPVGALPEPSLLAELADRGGGGDTA